MRTTAQQDETASAEPPARFTALLVADPLVRIALRQMLREADDLVVAGEASVDQAAEAARRLRPDVALVDANRLPEGRLRAFLIELRAASPGTRTLVLSEDDEGRGVVHAAGAGAWALLPRDVDQHRLVRALRLVLAGRAVVDCALPHQRFVRLAELDHAVDGSGRSSALSEKETSVIRAMAEGATDEQIARRLGVSVPTVKSHVRSILRKTRARNRAAAIAAAFRAGILT